MEHLERIAATGVTPKALAERPALLSSIHWHYQCFLDMMHDRSYDQGTPLRLKTSDIHAYWKAFNLDAWGDFYDKIRMIDRIWSTEVAKRHKLKADQAAAQAKAQQSRVRRR